MNGPESANMAIIAESLRVAYGALTILKDVSFSVASGETLAIIGPNGAGKTTLFKALTGEKIATSGRILHDGKDITHQRADQRVANGIARTFQVARIFPLFTVEANVAVTLESRARYQRIRRHSFSRRPREEDRTEARRILERVGLAHLGGQEARYLSYGDKKRLEIAIAIALRPKILMLDEPMAGMSPADRKKTTAIIAQIRRELGLTILLTEHDMDVVFALADRIMVLNQGALVVTGTPDEVRQNQAVRDIYLGMED